MFHAKRCNSADKGFSFIELLLVVAIIAIIAALSAPFMVRFLRQNELEVSSDKVVSTIRKAQNYAMSGKDNALWGFCASGNSIRLYKDSCGTPSYFEDFELSKIRISGLTDVAFDDVSGRRGEPSTISEIVISNDAGVRSVSINYAGGITFE